jgi:GT2 family glycosyltransferase
MELSIIIVNYNGQLFLKNCFESIKNCLKNVAYEIIIIDNNSSDDSCNFIKENFKNVILIE